MDEEFVEFEDIHAARAAATLSEFKYHCFICGKPHFGWKNEIPDACVLKMVESIGRSVLRRSTLSSQDITILSGIYLVESNKIKYVLSQGAYSTLSSQLKKKWTFDDYVHVAAELAGIEYKPYWFAMRYDKKKLIVDDAIAFLSARARELLGLTCVSVDK
jgi:hypothetical protein